jgi:glycosyltransferase involved in cell wall biosynthesis
MKVSCVVPAYNEAKRISDVIHILVIHPLIDEVIVVNDASTDNTQKILEKISGITLINHEVNRGKTQAVMTGVKKSKNDLVILIDSDLIGLSKEAITNLILPIVNSESDMTISLRKNALSIYKMMGIDFVSGERVFNKKLLLDHEEKLQHLPGFGLEVFINQLVITQNLRLKVVYWDTVISPRKSAKIGFFLGSLGDLKMILQILKTVPLSNCIYQMYMMRKLSRR